MDTIDRFIKLRILVAALGEKHSASWWESDFLGENGIRFLAFAFPRAPEAAAIQGACEAARRTHDERIGTKGTVHLFRQQYEAELVIHERLMLGGSGLRDDILGTYSNPQACKAALAELAGESEHGKEGPVKLGLSSAAFSSPMIKRMAAIYAGAFEEGKIAFPYFVNPA